jgi:hypothetical protein
VDFYQAAFLLRRSSEWKVIQASAGASRAHPLGDLSARILSACISPRSPIDIARMKEGIAGIGSLADDDCPHRFTHPDSRAQVSLTYIESDSMRV